VQRPQHKSTSDSVGAPKKNNFGTIFIEFGDTKKCHHFGGLEFVRKRELAVSAACTKVKHAFKSSGTIRKKFLLFESYKVCAICAILREKPHFGAYREAKKGVARGQVL